MGERRVAVITGAAGGIGTELTRALLPQMLQSIEVLQLATADLMVLLDRELQQSSFAQTSKGKIARQLITFIAQRLNQV